MAFYVEIFLPSAVEFLFVAEIFLILYNVFIVTAFASESTSFPLYLHSYTVFTLL